MTEARIITGVSVSHRRASVDVVESAGAPSEREAVEVLLAQPGVREAFAVQTCNRAEAYVVTTDATAGRDAIAGYVADVPDEAVRELDHEASLRHLMRVAAGLESLVLGEDQIIGQFRDAVETAREADGVGPILDEALTKALHVGERARTETAINEGVVSLGSAAVRLADQERDVADASALVVGAGEMATLAAKSLAESVDELVVANRSRDRAEHLSEALPVETEAVGLGMLPAAIADAELVVTATAATVPIVDGATLDEAGDTYVVDIGQPRDVAPDAAEVSDVTVRDLDDLESVTDETLDRREAAAERVEAMIDEEFDHLLTRYKRKRADQVIAAMHRGAERIKEREVGKAVSRLETEGRVTDEQRAVVESMADALVSQLLAAPTESLRDAAEEDDWSTIHTALRLFDPSTADPSEIVDAGAPEDLPETMREGMPSAVLDQLAAGDDSQVTVDDDSQVATED